MHDSVQRVLEGMALVAAVVLGDAPIKKGVTVKGKAWTAFNPDKETITLLRGLTGTVAVTAQY